MEADTIKRLYSENKMFEGKPIKYFKDPREIKKNQYAGLMTPGEEIIFGIKKTLEFYLMTDKAFYYVTAGKYKDNVLTPSATKRTELGDIMEWKVDDDSGHLLINTDEISFTAPLSRQEKAFLQSIRNIFAGIADVEPKAGASGAVKRKAVDPQLVWQLYTGHSIFSGKKLRYYKDTGEIKGNEFSAYSAVWGSGERVLFVLSKDFKKHIMTDKAFYYENDHYGKRRLAFGDIVHCEADLVSGHVTINDDVIDLGKPTSGEEIQIASSLESIICGIIDLTTDFASLPPLAFEETASVAEGCFTKSFTEKLTEDDMRRSWELCRTVYKSSETVLMEIPVLVEDAGQAAEPFIGIGADERLMFKYDVGPLGFYVTNKRFGIYNGGKEGAISLLLSQIDSITVRNYLGKLYLTLNGNDSMTVEIIKPCMDSCAALLISLCYAKGERKLARLMNYVEQFRRLRALKTGHKVESSISAAPKRLEMLGKGFQCDLNGEGFLTFWSSGGNLISLSDSRICYRRILSDGRIKSMEMPLQDIRNIGIDFRFREVTDSHRGKGFAAGLLLGGISGALVGSMIGYGKADTSLEFSGCDLVLNGDRESLPMNIAEAMLLRLVFAAMIRPRV